MNPNDPQLYDTLAYLQEERAVEQIGAELAAVMTERPDLDLREVVELTIALDGDLNGAVAALDDRTPAPPQQERLEQPLDPAQYEAAWNQLHAGEVPLERAMAEEQPPKPQTIGAAIDQWAAARRDK